MLTQDDVIYMIVTDRFWDGDPSNDSDVDRADPQKRHGGDLMGIVQRMPYLRALGVSVLWLTPVYANSSDGYHGYHPVDFEAVDDHLCSDSLGPRGSQETIRRFTEIAHENGLKVMLDLIVSHTALDHPWLKERPDWFDPKGSSSAEKWWIWGLPHLNHDNIDVTVYFAENVLNWIARTGVDAIRIDAARHVEKRFWTVFKLFAKGLHPTVSIVGEVWDADPQVVAPYQNKYDFDSMFDYPVYHAMLDVFIEDRSMWRLACPELSVDEPPGIINLDDDYRDAYQLITFIGNQDTVRFLSLAASHQGDPWARMKLALCFLFTTRGIPQVYYGDELGMEGGPDPDNRRDMPWDLAEQGDPRATACRDFVSRLIHVRRSSKALCYGLLTTLYVTQTLYAFARTFLDDIRIVVLNNSPEPVDVVIPFQSNERLPHLTRRQVPDGLVLTDELDPTGRESVQFSDGNLRVRLPGKSSAVYVPVRTG